MALVLFGNAPLLDSAPLESEFVSLAGLSVMIPAPTRHCIPIAQVSINANSKVPADHTTTAPKTPAPPLMLCCDRFSADLRPGAVEHSFRNDG